MQTNTNLITKIKDKVFHLIKTNKSFFLTILALFLIIFFLNGMISTKKEKFLAKQSKNQKPTDSTQLLILSTIS